MPLTTKHKHQLATAIANQFIDECCRDAAHKHIHAKDTLKQQLFDEFYKNLAKYEEMFRELIQAHWDEEEKVIIRNLKKLKHAFIVAKDAEDSADQAMFPKTQFTKKLGEGAAQLYTIVVESLGEDEIAKLDLGIEFNLAEPEIKKFLDKYPFKFAEDLVDEDIEKLRRVLIKSFEEGDGIPQMIKKIRGEFDDWSKYRAERVARSEANRAASEANLSVYRDAGITKKIWNTNPEACIWCEPLDGEVISIEANFFELGDTISRVDENGEKVTRDVTYTAVGAPPLHPNCLCFVTAEVE